MKKAHLVTVLGREIPVRSSAPESAVREVEAFVNSRIEEVRGGLASADAQLLLTLAFLNLAEQYLAIKSEKSGSAGMEKRLNLLISRLDKALGENGLFRET